MNLLKHNNKKGFTLIEAVLTIVIISVGLFGMMILFDNVTRGAIDGDLNIMSTYLAREKVERIVFDKVYSGYAYVTAGNYLATENVVLVNNNFTREISIYEVNTNDLVTAQNGTGYKRIDVTVKWGTANSQKVVLTTLLTSY